MILTTERLVLRDFVESDWEAVLAYQSDPRYLRFYPWEERTEVGVRAFVQMFIDQQHETPRSKFQLAITLRETGRLIGNCGLRRASPTAFQADMGYELAPEEWGNGYATEAARCMLDFGFGELGLHRIWATCLAENTASARVLERIGMRQEGRMRQDQWMKGRWWDTLLYSILVDEWKARG
jgi:ribosomal-protein-alanine N-acetyltransferase